METLITHLPTAIFMIFAAIGGAILPKQIKIAEKNNNLIMAIIVFIMTIIITVVFVYCFHQGYIEKLFKLSPFWSVGFIMFGMISFLATVYFLGSHYGTFGPFITGILFGYLVSLCLLDQQIEFLFAIISAIIFCIFLLIGIIKLQKESVEIKQ